MKLGYLLIWHHKHDEESLRKELELIGCERIYVDRIDKKSDPRPGRNKLLRNWREGDDLHVIDLFSLCISWKEVAPMLAKLRRMEIKLFVGIDQQLEFTQEIQDLFLSLVGSMNKFKVYKASRSRRNRTRGNPGAPKGPRGQDGREKAFKALALDKEGMLTVGQIAEELGVTKSTAYRYIEWAKAELRKKK